MLIGLSTLTILSCSEESLTGTQEDQPLSQSENTMTSAQMQAQAKQMVQSPSPQEISKAFFAMAETVQVMKREELEQLTEAEILELGRPILDATEGTTSLSKPTLEKLNNVLKPLAENIGSIPRKEHQAISEQVNRILDADATRRVRSLESNQVRQILFNMNGGATTMSATCEDMYDQWGGYVHLYPGDNLDIANGICPAGSIFYVHAGTFYGQSVSGSKNENTWVGVGGIPILEGQGSVTNAFSGGMYKNSISWMEIRNYTDYGIFSQSSSTKKVDIKSMMFKNIAPSKNGKFHGAVTFENCEDIDVRNSSFEGVASGILFTNCNGPLKAVDNEALNPGRNFFQCDKCEGGGIRVNGNSLEHTTGYGSAVLEDWINIFDSKGASGDYIQVNNNRARIILNNGNAVGVSDSGCFILLGDRDGRHQEAKNNIGVNPGNCGIGLAGGTHMFVAHNKMYSEEIPGISNVGYYSRNFSTKTPQPPCLYHHYISQSNLADWICGNSEHCNPPAVNKAHANGSCTDENDIVIDNTLINTLIKQETLGSGIWNDW